MAQEEVIRLFDSAQIRVVWDSDTEKYYFSVVDVIQVLALIIKQLASIGKS